MSPVCTVERAGIAYPLALSFRLQFVPYLYLVSFVMIGDRQAGRQAAAQLWQSIVYRADKQPTGGAAGWRTGNGRLFDSDTVSLSIPSLGRDQPYFYDFAAPSYYVTNIHICDYAEGARKLKITSGFRWQTKIFDYAARRASYSPIWWNPTNFLPSATQSAPPVESMAFNQTNTPNRTPTHIHYNNVGLMFLFVPHCFASSWYDRLRNPFS